MPAHDLGKGHRCGRMLQEVVLGVVLEPTVLVVVFFVVGVLVCVGAVWFSPSLSLLLQFYLALSQGFSVVSIHGNQLGVDGYTSALFGATSTTVTPNLPLDDFQQSAQWFRRRRIYGCSCAMECRYRCRRCSFRSIVLVVDAVHHRYRSRRSAVGASLRLRLRVVVTSSSTQHFVLVTVQCSTVD